MAGWPAGADFTGGSVSVQVAGEKQAGIERLGWPSCGNPIALLLPPALSAAERPPSCTPVEPLQVQLAKLGLTRG
jgi:hypothetical protein